MSEHVEVHIWAGDDNWEPLPPIQRDGQPGSLTHYRWDGDQQLYIFGWVGNHGGPCVWEAPPGYRVAHRGGDRAVISHAELNIYADLTVGPAMIQIIDCHGDASIVRFTYQPAD